MIELGERAVARTGSPESRVRKLRACAAATALAVCWAGAAADASDRTMQLVQAPARAEFKVGAQPLAGALREFSAQSGIQFAYRAEDVEGLRSPGVQGAHAPEQALVLLLAGTGLTFRFSGPQTVTLDRPVLRPGQAQALDTLTVLGSRRPDVPLSNVPSSITQVPREEIQAERAITNRVEDILTARVPGFNPTNNGVRQIRGRTAQVFVNGVPVNEQLRASSASDLNLLAPDQLSGVEVSRGANSAYGFGSPGGIIALQTPRAESDTLTLHSTVRESFNPTRVGGSHQTSFYQSASQRLGKFDFHVGGALGYDGADFAPDGGIALGFDNAALITNGKEILGNFDGSFGYDLGEAGRVRLSTTFGYVDFIDRYTTIAGVQRQRFGSLTLEPRGGDSFRRAHTINLSYENGDVLGSAVKIEGLMSEVETQVFTLVGTVDRRDEQTNAYRGVRTSVATPLDLLHQGTVVTYGFDFLRNNYFRPVFNDATGAIVTFFSPDVTLDSYAPYAQLEVPVGPVTLSGGVRHEEYRGHIETAVGTGGVVGGDIRGFGLTLFNAGALYPVTDRVELYATFSQGAEISQLGRAARGAARADLVDPQPAKSNQYEVGTRGNWKGVSVGLAGFFTESDLLSALTCDGINPCTPLREPRKFWGVEVNADWRINEQWTLGGVLTWLDGIREDATGDTRRIGSRDAPPVLVTANLGYSPFGWWRNRLQLSYRGGRDPFGTSTAFGEGRVDDLLLVNLSAAFDIGPGELQLGVRNLFNTEYTSIPAEADNQGFTYLPEQGTRVSVSSAVKW
jgi:iron complex outermembrane recepter protein